MKMFANENLFEPIIDYLEGLGHDVLSIRDSGLSGISDDEVYKRACNEKQVIITMDKDFSRIFRFPPDKWFLTEDITSTINTLYQVFIMAR